MTLRYIKTKAKRHGVDPLKAGGKEEMSISDVLTKELCRFSVKWSIAGETERRAKKWLQMNGRALARHSWAPVNSAVGRDVMGHWKEASAGQKEQGGRSVQAWGVQCLVRHAEEDSKMTWFLNVWKWWSIIQQYLWLIKWVFCDRLWAILKVSSQLIIASRP